MGNPSCKRPDAYYNIDSENDGISWHLQHHCPAFFFLRAFLTAERSVARTVLLVSLQALGTMLAIYIPAAPGCAEERAKSKPVSLQKGWKSAVVGGAGDFSEDLADGRGIAVEVVAAR